MPCRAGSSFFFFPSINNFKELFFSGGLVFSDAIKVLSKSEEMQNIQMLTKSLSFTSLPFVLCSLDLFSC